jgi:NTE family protein
MSAWSPDLRRSEARTEAGVNTTLVDQHQPVAFVLTGGAGHGAVQVGMLQALAAAGIVPDLLVGSSAGALNAMAYGSSPTPAGLQRLVDAWRGARRGDVFPLHPSDLLPAMLGRRDHLISPLGLRNWLATHLELDVLEHAVIPVHVVATDLATGRPVVISTGEAVTALMASSAVPSLFPPVALDGRLLVDGSVSADTPVTQASELGARTTYVLSTRAVSGAPFPRTAARLALYAYLQISANWSRDQAAARLGSTVHVLPVPDLHGISPFDLSAADDLITAGRLATESWLTSFARPRLAIAA